jgi:hypothetical protein
MDGKGCSNGDLGSADIIAQTHHANQSTGEGVGYVAEPADLTPVQACQRRNQGNYDR